MNRFFTRILFGCIAAAVSTAFAAPIPIADHSFEMNGPSCTGGTWCNDIGPEWTGTNDGGTTLTQVDGGFFEENIGGFSSDGEWHLGIASNHTVFQQLDATYEANTTYRLTVGVGHRGGFTNTGGSPQTGDGNFSTFGFGNSLINSVDAGILVPEGEFRDFSIELNTADFPALVGQDVNILLSNLDFNVLTDPNITEADRFVAGPGRSHYDNIRLDVVPEPASFGLIAMALFGLLGFRRR